MKVMNPKPRDLPCALSNMTTESSISPYAEKCSCKPSFSVDRFRPPTKILRCKINSKGWHYLEQFLQAGDVIPRMTIAAILKAKTVLHLWKVALQPICYHHGENMLANLLLQHTTYNHHIRQTSPHKIGLRTLLDRGESTGGESSRRERETIMGGKSNSLLHTCLPNYPK